MQEAGVCFGCKRALGDGVALHEKGCLAAKIVLYRAVTMMTIESDDDWAARSAIQQKIDLPRSEFDGDMASGWLWRDAIAVVNGVDLDRIMDHVLDVIRDKLRDSAQKDQ